MATAMIGEDLEADTDLGQMSVSLCDDSSLNDSTMMDTSMPDIAQHFEVKPEDIGVCLSVRLFVCLSICLFFLFICLFLFVMIRRCMT
jgi:hypothetical protein